MSIYNRIEEIGIELKIDVNTHLLITDGSSIKLNFFRGGWMDYPDSENYLSLFYKISPNGPNYTHFSDEI